MIYIFKTSVKTKKAVQQLKPYLLGMLPQLKWSFDLEDCDKVLRLEASADLSEAVIRLLHDKGFNCEELID